MKKNDPLLLGQQFTNWTVVDPEPAQNGPHRYWYCRCFCGKEKYVNEQSLLKGKSTSCGCSSKANKIKNLGAYGTGEALKGKTRPWTAEWKQKCKAGRQALRDKVVEEAERSAVSADKKEPQV